MKLKGVTINNYKSFGEEDNFLYLDKLNTIIGKNESGKSNIIDVLANINMIGLTEREYFLPRNRKNNKEIKVVLNFETYEKESTMYKFHGNADITLESDNNFLLSGDLANFIAENEIYNSIINKIEDLNKTGIHFQNQNSRNEFNKLLDDLRNASSRIFIDFQSYKNIRSSLKQTNNENYIKIAEAIEEAINFLESLYCDFPAFVKIEDIMLKSKYNIENIGKDKLLEKLFSICNINIEELMQKMKSTDAAEKRNYERDINYDIRNNFTNDFNDFYSQEKVEIEIAVNQNEINILVDTTNRYLEYDERSNGLKWYISAFIQLQYMEKKNCKSIKNNIILMDEPGVYLHANAQKEVVQLLFDLVKNENQIIYTTHSPFMIDTHTTQNIRSVIKDENGFSHIYNKITNIPTNSKSTYDTITPLTNALGLDLNYNIGPSFNNNNIIVEGITDYLYLQGYYKCKKIKNIPNIIPSTGADNIPAITSILYGWNCDFNILVDQDEKGRSIYDSLNDKNQPFLDKLLFADGNCEKVSKSDYEIENLFSDNDKIKFGIKNEDYAEHKYNYAYATYSKILLEEEKYDDETMKNFDKIIKQINNLNKGGD